MIRTSYVQYNVSNIYDIFYKNTNGDQFDQTSLSKFIAESDDFNIFGYLTGAIDENICLYSWFMIENSEMKDDHLGEFLPTWCSFSSLGTTHTSCFDSLRFTDLKDSTKLYDGFIGSQVTFKYSPGSEIHQPGPDTPEALAKMQCGGVIYSIL